MMDMCSGCRGYRDGYIGSAMAPPPGNRRTYDGNSAMASYYIRYDAGSKLRADEWATGYRTRSMFDLDDPEPDPMYVPRIPQAVDR